MRNFRSSCLGCLLLAAAALLAACDALPSARAGGDETPLADASQRPEGWESIDDEGSAMRMYYQFVDARGRVRFVERIDEVPEAWRESVGFVKMAMPPPLSPGDAERARRVQLARSGGVKVARSAAGAPEIILYSADWCGWCRKAKRHLDGLGINYEIRDIDIPQNMNDLVAKTGQRGIPVLDVGGRVVTGFSPGKYDELIRQRT